MSNRRSWTYWTHSTGAIDPISGSEICWTSSSSRCCTKLMTGEVSVDDLDLECAHE